MYDDFVVVAFVDGVGMHYRIYTQSEAAANLYNEWYSRGLNPTLYGRRSGLDLVVIR